MTYFQENFNFTVQETVAILGAHSLGRARYATTIRIQLFFMTTALVLVPASVAQM